jgi:hypothetical protein
MVLLYCYIADSDDDSDVDYDGWPSLLCSCDSVSSRIISMKSINSRDACQSIIIHDIIEVCCMKLLGDST